MILQTRWQYSILVLLMFFCTTSFIGAKETTTVPNHTFENLNTEKSDTKHFIGALEHVRLVPPNVILKARIDTGAKTTSIDARNITPFERNGKQWVKFICIAGEKEHAIERKVLKTVLIKRHGEESQNRYVVNMRIILGEVSQLIAVTLNNRKNYKYPVLIGRNFLRDYFVVDVAKEYQFKPMDLPK